MVFLHDDFFLKLRTEVEEEAPNQWLDVKRRIAHKLVEQLLQDLEGIPSPQGQLFYEIRDAKIRDIFKGA